jgi:hypothetical protein
MSTEFIIGTTLSVTGIIAGIIIYFLQKPPKITAEQVSDIIVNHLIDRSIKNENNVCAKIIFPIINHYCSKYKMPAFSTGIIIDKLIVQYESLPLQLQTDTTHKIVERLRKFGDNDVIVEHNIECADESPESMPAVPSSKNKSVGKTNKTDYGKSIKEYMKDVYDEMEFGVEYDTAAIKNRLSALVKENSGMNLDAGTARCQMYKAIVNEPNRVFYGVNTPLDASVNLFYYPSENQRQRIKKFSMTITENPKIYWMNKGEKMSKNTNELREQRYT